MEYITVHEWAEKNGVTFREALNSARRGRLSKYAKRKVFKVTKIMLPAELKNSDVPDGRTTRWKKAAGKPS